MLCFSGFRFCEVSSHCAFHWVPVGLCELCKRRIARNDGARGYRTGEEKMLVRMDSYYGWVSDVMPGGGVYSYSY